MKKLTALTAGLLMMATTTFAQVTPQALATDYQAQGYTRVEIKTGPTQIKVEAIRGTTKTEVIYDKATGAVLKSETEAVDGDDNTRPGVSIRNRNRDFVRSSTGVRDRGEGSGRKGKGRGRGRGSDDGAGDDRRGRGSDDGAGHDRRGRGADDDHDDDNGGDRGGRGRGSDD